MRQETEFYFPNCKINFEDLKCSQYPQGTDRLCCLPNSLLMQEGALFSSAWVMASEAAQLEDSQL